MLVKATVQKVDNGFRGMLVDWEDSNITELGLHLFNRHFKPFSKGTLFEVLFNVTPTGRRVVKKILGIKKEEEGAHMASLADTVAEIKVERISSDGVVIDTYVADTKSSIKEFLESSKERLVVSGRADPKEISEVIDDEIAAWTAIKAERVELTGDDGVIRAVSRKTESVDERIERLRRLGREHGKEALVRELSSRGSASPSLEAEMILEQTEAPATSKRAARKAKDAGAIDGYYVSHEARLIFNTAKKLSETRPERAVKVMMVGASGYGKTTLPKLFAELTGKRFLRMNCATIRDPEEWFGYREAREGSTLFIRSQFGREIEEGNLVVVLDEFNRLEPWLHNTLFPLLDDDGATVVHDEEFKIGPGVIVVGTINTGYKYTGTFELDEALFNRFDFTLEVGPMPHTEEVKVLAKRTEIDKEAASHIVKMSNILRQNDVICSTRTSLLVANMVVAGMHIREAFESAVVRRVPGDSSSNGLRKQIVDLINVQLGPFEPRELEQDVFAPKKRVKVQDDEESKVAAKTEPDSKEHVLTLHHDKSKDLLFINVVGLFRKLPIKGERSEMGEMEVITLSRAHQLADRIRQGEEVELRLTHRPADLSNIIEALRGAGLTGNFALKAV